MLSPVRLVLALKPRFRSQELPEFGSYRIRDRPSPPILQYSNTPILQYSNTPIPLRDLRDLCAMLSPVRLLLALKPTRSLFPTDNWQLALETDTDTFYFACESMGPKLSGE
jgi:hypothetical protein